MSRVPAAVTARRSAAAGKALVESKGPYLLFSEQLPVLTRDGLALAPHSLKLSSAAIADRAARLLPAIYEQMEHLSAVEAMRAAALYAEAAWHAACRRKARGRRSV